MSLDAMIWAVKDAPLADCEEHAVLTVMADEADEDGCGVWLAIPTIAERARLSERQAARCVKDLRERGVLGLGDQSLAARIRADRRPVVYDLLIPFSWFGVRIERVNRSRDKKGLEPLTAASRPDIAEPPPRKRRSDAGSSRARQPIPDGVTSSHADAPDGVTSSRPADGVTNSPPGLVNRHGVTSKSPRGDYQSYDPVSNPVKETPGGTLPPDPLRPQAPPTSGLETDLQPETFVRPQQPRDLQGDHRPRAGEHAVRPPAFDNLFSDQGSQADGYLPGLVRQGGVGGSHLAAGGQSPRSAPSGSHAVVSVSLAPDGDLDPDPSILDPQRVATVELTT
jgi:hypothetical protein